MSGWQPKEGSGSLFKNKNKTADNHPVSRGDIMLGGVVYELAAWRKTGRDGEDFLSLSGKPKEARPAPSQRREAPRQEPQRQAGGGDLDDDVPFAACWQ
jgi:hypothetical protein